MGNRLSKIITRSGDDGTTAIADGSRLKKTDQRIHCLGEVDELNALIGLIINMIEDAELEPLLLQIQHDLFDMGAELSLPDKQLLNEDYVLFLEQKADSYNASLPALKEFILPGGSTNIAYLHMARTFSRRVERSCISLNQKQTVNPYSLQYFNRLSDLFFILSRYLCQKEGNKEVYWQSKYSRHN